MIKTIIIDDEQHAAHSMEWLLKKNYATAINIAGIFLNVEDGINAIKKLQPELVFLDVQIGSKTGFDVLRQFPEMNFDVIFVTAFEKYAIQAFKFCAIDYLLKPVNAVDLDQAIEKFLRFRKSGQSSLKVETLLENVILLKQFAAPKKIIVPTISGFELLSVADIIRCQSDVNYTTIYIIDKRKIVVAKTLKEFEDMLCEYNFFRVHNSHLVNLSYIKSYQKGKGGIVIMNDGSQVDVSIRRKDEFLQKVAQL